MNEVDQFVAKWDGKLINNGGIQCVAVANQVESEIVKGGWIGTPLTGYANDWWNNWGNDADYDNYIRVGADQPAQKGDLAVWQRYNGNGLPHIALVIDDKGGNIYCLTQNPGNAHKETLTKNGLLGYLRPKKFIQVAPAVVTAPAPSGEFYNVQSGNTFWALEDAFGLPHGRLQELNPGVNPKTLAIGQQIRIRAAAAPSAPAGGTVHLPGTADSWRLYNEAGPYVIGTEKAKLAPSQFGGLSYQILGSPAANVVIIQTQMFGRGAIYVGPDTPATFS